MKSLSIGLPLLLILHFCDAQYDNINKNDSLKILDAKYEYRTLDINKNEHANVQLLYDTIMFKDVRYDTSFIAIVYPLFHFSKTYNVKLNLDNGFAKNVSNYFNYYYKTNNNNSHKELVCYIKKFSITLQYDFLEHYNEGDLRDDILNLVNIEVECYYKSGDTLFPAARFDTAYAHHFPEIILNMSSILKELLKPLMNKIESINAESVIKRKSYTEEEITERYAKRFDIPILTTNIYKKGVYKNFNEFRNNTPSIDSFNISADKIKVSAANQRSSYQESLFRRIIQKRNTAIFLYNKNNQLITPSEIFGYCDGSTLWIQHGAFYYPLVRISNAFEFMYIFHFSDNNKNTYTRYILMPLNMETGFSN